MTASTVSKVMEQRLIRGTRVVVADSYGNPKFRGKTLVVASKSTVKCNGKGRCAGDGSWCVGKAVFLVTESSSRKDKKMGWRKGAEKICLTHLKDEGGVLLVPPPLTRQAASPLSDSVRMSDTLDPNTTTGAPVVSSEVTWDAIARAHQSGNIDEVAQLARVLKARTEELKTRVIHLQDEMLERLIREE